MRARKDGYLWAVEGARAGHALEVGNRLADEMRIGSGAPAALLRVDVGAQLMICGIELLSTGSVQQRRAGSDVGGAEGGSGGGR